MPRYHPDIGLTSVLGGYIGPPYTTLCHHRAKVDFSLAKIGAHHNSNIVLTSLNVDGHHLVRFVRWATNYNGYHFQPPLNLLWPYADTMLHRDDQYSHQK